MPGLARGRPLAEWGALSPLLQRSRSPAVHTPESVQLPGLSVSVQRHLGDPLHGTHLPLKTWLLAMYLMATSTHGISARRLSLWLGIGYRSAWHLAHLNRYLAEIAYRWNRRRVSAEERLLGLLAGMATGPLTFAECVR